MLIHAFETSTNFSKFENFYRSMPGRILVIIMLATCSSFAFFKGTWVDIGFAGLTACAAGIIHYSAVSGNHLVGKTQDMLVSIVAALIATIGMTVSPNGTCFSAEVMGTLFWFLYGTAFMISLTEIYNGQLVCGVTRLALALFNTFGLAIGSSVGLWMAAYGGEERFTLAERDCEDVPRHKIPELYLILFYPLTQIAAMMQLRVMVKHWPATFMTQAVAVVSQYLIGKRWGQPTFVANLIPAYLATVCASAFMTIGNRLNLTGIKPWSEGVLDYVSSTKLPTQTTFRSLRSLKFKESGWSKGPHNYHRGYLQKSELKHNNRDIWFCIVPAIYLLVPGSSLLRTSFRAVWATASPDSEKEQDTSALTSVFIIGFGQAVGVRLAMTTLEAIFEYIVTPCARRRKDGKS